MKRIIFMVYLIAICLIAVLLTVGCTNNNNLPSIDVTGRWILTDYSNESIMAMNLLQSGRNVTGNIVGDQLSHLSGTVSGSELTATVQWGNGDVSNADGSVSTDGLTMNGTFRTLSGVSTQWSAKRM